MTTICAVKKGRRLCIASDALSLFGSRKEIDGTHVYGDGKIIKIGPNFVAIAGHPSWELILNQYFSDKKKCSQWETADQIFEIFTEFHKKLRERYFHASSALSCFPFALSELELLIINPYGIFEVDYMRMVRHYRYFSAMGTGEEYALGAIKALFDLIKEPEEIAKIGIEAAAQFDRKTDLPIHMQCINLET